jgi:hypothetical protein
MLSAYPEYAETENYSLCPPSKKEINMVSDRKYLESMNKDQNKTFNYFDTMRLYITKCNKAINPNCKSD